MAINYIESQVILPPSPEEEIKIPNLKHDKLPIELEREARTESSLHDLRAFLKEELATEDNFKGNYQSMETILPPSKRNKKY